MRVAIDKRWVEANQVQKFRHAVLNIFLCTRFFIDLQRIRDNFAHGQARVQAGICSCVWFYLPFEGVNCKTTCCVPVDFGFFDQELSPECSSGTWYNG